MQTGSSQRRITVLATHADSELMQQVRAGHLDSLAVLFDRHHRALFAYFLRSTSARAASEDLTQEVFVRILKYRQTFLPGSPFSTWMYQIARNVHLDWLRRRRPESPLEHEGEALNLASSLPRPDDSAQHAQHTLLLRRALDRLPADKRELLILARFQNLSYDQISRILCIETGAVKVRVFRALKELSRTFHSLAQETQP